MELQTPSLPMTCSSPTTISMCNISVNIRPVGFHRHPWGMFNSQHYVTLPITPNDITRLMAPQCRSFFHPPKINIIIILLSGMFSSQCPTLILPSPNETYNHKVFRKQSTHIPYIPWLPTSWLTYIHQV